MYSDGSTLKEIQKELNVSQPTITKILREKKIRLREGFTIIERHRNKVVELYSSGKGISYIMDKTGIKSTSTIYRILIEAGIEKRNRKIKNNNT